MDQVPLVIEEKDAGAELVRRFHETMPVKAAFWLQTEASSQWYLYIASEAIDDTTLDRGYREVSQLTRSMPTPYLDPFHVKLIGADHPLARAALDIHRRYPGSSATNFDGMSFGGIGVEGVYIYPSTITESHVL